MKETILKQIGLTDYETKIYLELLKSGAMSAYRLAEKARLYRQVTYDTLKRLEEKGYVSSVMEKKTKIFKATEPELILEMLHEKTESFKQVVPELNKLDKASKQPVIVETYRGKNVLRLALRDIINQLKNVKKKEVLCTAVDESIPHLNQKTINEQYERDMLRLNITERVIIKKGSKGIFQKGTSVYKTVSEAYFNENPTQVYGDNVQIIIWGNPDHLIIIRNKEVAESYRKQFELMWKGSKP